MKQKSKLSHAQIAKIVALNDQGCTTAEIATMLGVTTSSARDVLGL